MRSERLQKLTTFEYHESLRLAPKRNKPFYRKPKSEATKIREQNERDDIVATMRSKLKY